MSNINIYNFTIPEDSEPNAPPRITRIIDNIEYWSQGNACGFRYVGNRVTNLETMLENKKYDDLINYYNSTV